LTVDSNAKFVFHSAAQQALQRIGIRVSPSTTCR
jgi:hypothetical protein